MQLFAACMTFNDLVIKTFFFLFKNIPKLFSCFFKSYSKHRRVLKIQSLNCRTVTVYLVRFSSSEYNEGKNKQTRVDSAVASKGSAAPGVSFLSVCVLLRQHASCFPRRQELGALWPQHTLSFIGAFERLVTVCLLFFLISSAVHCLRTRIGAHALAGLCEFLCGVTGA